MATASYSSPAAPAVRAGPGRVRIGVLGGGPAGLMTALSLEAYLPGQVEVVLLDRNASETDYPGVEYGIQERACRALERIGQLEPAMVDANPCTELAFRNSRLGRRFSSIAYDSRYTRSVVRQEFLARLAGLLRQTEVRRRHLVTAVKDMPDGSVLVEGHRGETPFGERFDLLVAADGIHSVVRKTIFPQSAQVFDRGFSCLYMLLEATPETAPPGFLERANSGRSELVMGAIATMTLFPLGRGKLSFGIGFDHAVRDRLWRQAGVDAGTEWSDIPSATKAGIARHLASDAGDEAMLQALDLVPDWDSYKVYLWAMHDTDPLDPPVADSANIVMIGDAAHAIMPTIGMGASLAMEDAEMLARMMRDSGLIQAQDPAAFRAVVREKVLHPFGAARLPIWRDLVWRSRRAASSNFIKVGTKKRFAVGAQIPGRFRSRSMTAVELALETVGL